LTFERLAKIGKTVTPTKVWVQKSLKILDSGFRRKDEDGLLQEVHLVPNIDTSIAGLEFPLGAFIAAILLWSSLSFYEA
jgi:hypothetical protein